MFEIGFKVQTKDGRVGSLVYRGPGKDLVNKNEEMFEIILDEGFEKVLKVLLLENLLFFFSITTAFFPCDFARSILLMDFFKFPDNVSLFGSAIIIIGGIIIYWKKNNSLFNT